MRDLSSRNTLAKADRIKIQSDYREIQACRDDPKRLILVFNHSQSPVDPESHRSGRPVEEPNRKVPQSDIALANPIIVQAQSELAAIKESLDSELLKAPKAFDSLLKAAEANETSIIAAVSSQEQKVIRPVKPQYNTEFSSVRSRPISSRTRQS